MCGLCGIYQRDGAPVAGDVLAQMNALLIHRGPDSGGQRIDGPCGLANRRLAILDLSPSGALPMSSPDGQVTLAYNGEVYNHLALRPDLEARGFTFRSTSDAETVIALYRAYGLDFLAHLRGMFALALWDRAAETLILARDRLGQKPLYYYQDDARLVFGSEIKAVVRHPAVPRQPARDLVGRMLAYGYAPAPNTAFENIRMLLPGQALVVRRDQVHVETYWTPPAAAPSQPGARAADYFDELRATFDEAVRLRLLSDVPLGAFLSGGLDSSLIVAYMARHMSARVKTFAIGFSGESSFDETIYARQVADQLGTDHREFIVEPDAIDLLPFLVWHHDQPFADSSAIPTYLVSQHTRDHVTVALSGDGGDELFAGYERFYAANLAARYRRLPGPLQAAASALINRLPEATSYRGRVQRIRRFVEGASQPFEAAYFSWVRLFSDEQLGALLASDSAPSPTAHFTALFDPHDRRDLTARLLDVNLTTYLPDDLLIKADRASMAASLELRAPFLDHRLVELAARIPANLKLDGSQTKMILKAVASDVLPPEIIHRKKHGFGVPVGRWFRDDLAGYARDVLLDPSTLGRGYFQPAAVTRLLDEHISGERNHGQHIWLLLTFEWWHRLFIDATVLAAP